MTDTERELLEDELEREVAAAICAVDDQNDPEHAAEWAGAFIAELRKRRIVLYRRAVRALPNGLVQTTLEDFVRDNDRGSRPANEPQPSVREEGGADGAPPALHSSP